MIGLELVEDLQHFTASVPAESLGDKLASWVADVMHSYTERFSRAARRHGCDLIVLEARQAVTSHGELMGFSTVLGRRVNFPRREGDRPKVLVLPHGIASSIGRDDRSDVYRRRLQSAIAAGLVGSMENQALAGARYSDLLYGKLASLRMLETVRANPDPGVSEQFYACIIGGDRLVFIDNQLPPGADGREQEGSPQPFPAVAHTASELRDMASELHEVEEAELLAR